MIVNEGRIRTEGFLGRAFKREIYCVHYTLNSEITIEDAKIPAPEKTPRSFGQCENVSSFGRDYPSKQLVAGFNVGVENISTEYARFGLNPKEDFFIATK